MAYDIAFIRTERTRQHVPCAGIHFLVEQYLFRLAQQRWIGYRAHFQCLDHPYRLYTTASPTALGATPSTSASAVHRSPISTIPCTISVLPIELVSFTASPGTNAVDLEWSTASETDNDHFTVERSTDGTTFQDLLHVWRSRGA
ncbi:MAG: hypothetical protein R2818_08210 [Flavobacteriales bacterium]